MLRPRIPKLLPYESRGKKVLIFNYVPVFLFEGVCQQMGYQLFSGQNRLPG